MMNSKEEIIFDYNDYLEDERRIREGIMREEREEGIKEGIQKNKTEMVLNMHNKNISIEIIAECANLTVDEVKKIIDGNL